MITSLQRQFWKPFVKPFIDFLINGRPPLVLNFCAHGNFSFKCCFWLRLSVSREPIPPLSTCGCPQVSMLRSWDDIDSHLPSKLWSLRTISDPELPWKWSNLLAKQYFLTGFPQMLRSIRFYSRITKDVTVSDWVAEFVAMLPNQHSLDLFGNNQSSVKFSKCNQRFCSQNLNQKQYLWIRLSWWFMQQFVV